MRLPRAQQAAPELGYLDTIDLDDPAAGALASYTVPGQSYVAVLAARAVLTTSSAVANRFVSLDYIDGRGNTRARNATGVLVVASTTGKRYEWNSGRAAGEAVTGCPVFAPCLGVYLPPATVIQVTVDAIDTGDQLSGVRLLIARVNTDSQDEPIPPVRFGLLGL